MQSDHFEEFFGPELEKHGYASVYKKKTAEVYTGTSYAIDGCATFFRRDRFSLVKKYEVREGKGEGFSRGRMSLCNASTGSVHTLHVEDVYVEFVSRHYCTKKVHLGILNAMDGCATFFRRDRFSLVKKCVRE